MNSKPTPRTSPWLTMVLSFGAIVLVFCIVLYPDQAFQASLQGLSVWWKLIFPTLLPFLVLSEMMIAFGLVHGLGVLLDPVMRRLFGIPGVGGWAFALGWTVGYPAGAEATAKLRQQQALSAQEANRLLSLSHVSNPIFIIVVLGVGFLHQPQTGIIIGLLHWTSAIVTGIILQMLSRTKQSTSSPHFEKNDAQSAAVTDAKADTKRWQLALNAMEQAHQADGRSFGRLLGDAVTAAVQKLMMIGGYIIMFSIVAHVLLTLIPAAIKPAYIQAVLELHIGTYALSNLPQSSAILQMTLLSGALAWSGFCAHLQVRSLTLAAGLNHTYFLISRIMHSMIAMLMTMACWTPLQALFRAVSPTIAPVWDTNSGEAIPQSAFTFPWYVLPSIFAGILLTLLLLSLCISFAKRRPI